MTCWPARDVENACIRCGGKGGSDFPSWMKYSVNGAYGACFRCKGTGVDPNPEFVKSLKKKEKSMCSKMKYKDQVISTRSGVVAVSAGQKKGKAQLSGFAKLERHSWWKNQGDAVPVAIEAETFVEGNVELSVPGGRIAGLGLRKDVKVNGKLVGSAKSVKMLTREARTPFEKSLHERIPVVYVGTDLYEFTSKDVVIDKDKLSNTMVSKQQELPFRQDENR